MFIAFFSSTKPNQSAKSKETVIAFFHSAKKQLLENLFAFNISVVISSVFSSYKNGGPKIIHSSERSHTFPICIRATLSSNETLRQGASYETRIEEN